MRLVVAADDFDAAVAFYRDTLGLAEELAVAGPGGAHVVILRAGRATLELVNAAQRRYIDEVEVGRPVSRSIRVAFEVDDAQTRTRQLEAAGASVLAEPTRTPWDSLNSRLEAPAELQITLFQEQTETPADDWERRVAEVWDTAKDRSEDEVVAAIAGLVAERPEDDAAALFEQASALDYTGREAEAEPFYRRAIAAGLDRQRQAYAAIQLASTIRNLGRAAEAVEILQAEPGGDELDDARAAFLALARHDAGQPAEALAGVLDALAGHMTDYRRAVTEYAVELRDRRIDSAQ